MSDFTKVIQQKISKLKPQNFIYPGLSLLFGIIVVIIFSSSIQFIKNNINSAYTGDIRSDTGILNMGNYTLVAKKLGITIPTKKELTPDLVTPPVEPEVTTPEAATTTDTTFDMKSLTIKVLNSTKTSGAAASLAAILEDAGFAKATIGNEPQQYASTVIRVKDGLGSLSETILEEVQNTYPDATISIATETTDFDITIIIGGK